MPTFTEAEVPGFDVRVVYGIIVPTGTPKEVVNKLSAEMAKIVAMPDFREKIVSQGLDPVSAGPDQFAAIIKADMAKFAKVIKAANIKLGN